MVPTDVSSINVLAAAEDAKAKVTGVGNHDLVIGDNNIDVVVTSESGRENKINIKVTRKDGYYLEDLDLVLNNEKIQEADIIIDVNSKISKEEIAKIKESKKIFRLNYYDENKKLIYSWIINGKEIKDSKEFTTTITFTTENVKEIYKLSNYADGVYINFGHSGDLLTGTKIKLYVGDKFENENIVKIYHYNDTRKSLDLIKDNLKVSDGYIEFEIDHCSEYFVTMSTIENISKEEINIFMIFAIIELVVIISLVVMIFIKLKKVKKNSSINMSKHM